MSVLASISFSAPGIAVSAPSVSYDELLDKQFKNSLETAHPSMQLALNSALVGLRSGTLNRAAGAAILAQYSVLPARIVDLLKLMRRRLFVFPNVAEELLRNIKEESGSETSNLAHYEILQRTVRDELSLDITSVTRHATTDAFIGGLESTIARQTPEFVVGIAYALEDSALPELEIVAEIINEYWRLCGHPTQLIRREMIDDENRHNAIKAERTAAAYTLEDFFIVHLQDFEVGHEERLRKNAKSYLDSPEKLARFQQGFEFTLSAMDDWWRGLTEMGAAIDDRS